jgi:hypothetical protein
MNKYQIIVNDTILDTFEDLDISLNYAITDITDVTKRKTKFSKTIELPGTPANNLFFKQIYDVNIDNISFNPNIKQPASISIGDNEVLTGDLQLLNIIINNKDVVYEIVIAGKLKTILTEVKDYYLTDLDFSEYDHIRSRETIINSWDHIITRNGTDTLVDKGQGYVYPYIVNGNSTDIYQNWYVYDSFPAIYVKEYIDKIFEFAGFTYTSNFFNSDYFKSLILPYTSESIQLTAEELNDLSVIVGVDSTKPETSSGTPPEGATPGYVDMFNDYVIKYEDPWYYTDVYYNPYLNREDGSVGDVIFRNGDDIFEDNIYFIDGDINPLFINETNFYDISFKGKLVPKWFSDGGEDVKWKGDGFVEYIYYLYKRSPDGTITLLDQSGIPPFVDGEYGTQFYTPSNTGFNASPWYDTQALLNINLSANNVWIEETSIVWVRVGVRWPSDVKWDIDGVLVNQNQKMNLRMTLAESIDGEPTVYSVIPSSNQNYSTNIPISMRQITHRIKMKDFFLNIVRMFNLIIQDNPDKTQDLIIEPTDDFFSSKEKVLDWTNKLDNDSDITITPMSELDFYSYKFTYKEDTDVYNESYTFDYSEIFGEREITIDNDFSQKEEKLELLFSPTPLSSYNINDRVAPFFVDIDNNEMKSKSVNYRILFYGGTIDCDTWYLKDYPTSDPTLISNLSKYPYCGMFNHPYIGTEDLSFGPVKTFYYDTGIGGVFNSVNAIPNSNLYNKFHQNTFRTLIDKNSRLFKGYFHLTPKDIATFDFRDVVFLNGSYWRVNEIKDFNPTNSDSLTEVILYKEINQIFFDLDTLDVPDSNVNCPDDLISVVNSPNSREGNYVTSRSGIRISDDCCRSLGLIPNNGNCLYPKINPGSVLTIEDQLYSPDSEQILPVQQSYGPKSLQKNNNTLNTIDVKVLGRSNYIPKNSSNSLIIGDNNSLIRNTKNTLVIGNNITPLVENSLYIGNVYIDENGEINNNKLYIIDSGVDTVINLDKTNFIDIIDGGENSVRNLGGDSKTRPIIMNSDNTSTQI